MTKNLGKLGKILASGKTKVIKEYPDDPGLGVVESKTSITAHDDPAFTKEFDTKAIYATTTTCRVFELLRVAGIPVAYVKQISETEFLAPICEMIKLEVVARRYAVGSYTKRNPQLEKPKGEVPHRFHRLAAEFFLKTTGGVFISVNGREVISGLDPKKGEEDPFIPNPYDRETWELHHAKKPLWYPDSSLGRKVNRRDVAYYFGMESFEEILRKTFLVLEGAWAQLGCRLIDFKIEFGLQRKGDLSTIFVADVIDNDNWRLRDQDWKELSKQSFREGEELSEVEKKYGLVAELVQRFRIPRQALVLWRGSESDDWPELPKDFNLAGCEVERITVSGHKSPRLVLDILENILAKYPEGGVIVPKVGMSNGLGPMLAARTNWPVVSIAASAKEFPEDLWSSARIPSQVPMATIMDEKNGILLALNILAQKNPVIYMQRQLAIEKLDE